MTDEEVRGGSGGRGKEEGVRCDSEEGGAVWGSRSDGEGS